MLRSLYSGVSGLTSHQTKMDVIGNNIANVNTYGYKTKRVTFRDIYYQSSKSATGGDDTQGGINPSQVGYGVSVATIDKIMARSSFQSTGRTLDVSIAGEGFLQVQDKSGNKFYTRNGDLRVDNNGNLTDGTGKFVLGVQNQDPSISEGLPSDPGFGKIQIKIPDVNIATNSVDVTGAPNGTVGTPKIEIGFLNGNQETPITVTLVKGTTDSVKYNNAADPHTMEISIKDYDNLKDLDALQSRINTIIENEKNHPTLNPDGTTFDPALSEGQLSASNYKAGPISIGLVTDGVTHAGGGSLTSADIKAIKEQAMKDIQASIGTKEFTIENQVQDFSKLSSFTIGENGMLIGTHSVHGVLVFGRIDLATFENPEGLEEAGNTYFTQTAVSGTAKAATPGFGGSGALVSSSLEMSNVNLAQEFSDMITTQRGFQANSRIITTSDSMLEELVNLKR